MRTYDTCALSELETLIWHEMLRVGLDPQDKEDILKYWEDKLDEHRGVYKGSL